MAYDQFDNAYRVQRLGAGQTLLPTAYAPAAVARELHRLVDGSTCRARCAEVAASCGAIAAACAAVLSLERGL